MEQNRPLLVTSEEINKLPILIVDKKGFIGSMLAKVLRDQFLVVVVTGHNLEKHDNIIHIPYRKKIPMIPDNAYSHIFVVYNGEKELLDMLSGFETKAEAVKARFLFITSLLYSSPKLFKLLQRSSYRLMQTVLYGEIFNNAISEANEVNFFIHQTRVYGRIEVPGEGLGKLYPISLDDVLTAIVSLAFAVEKPKETILLFPHHEYNEFTVARIIQKIDPLMKVDFSKRKSPANSFYIPKDGLYYYSDYNLEEKLRKIDLSRIGHRAKFPQQKIKLTMPSPHTKQNRLRIFFAILIAVFFAPIVAAILCALLGAGLLTFSAKQAESGDLQKVTSIAQAADYSFIAAQNIGSSLFLPQAIIPDQTEMFLDAMQTGETIATTEMSVVQSVEVMKTIYEGKSNDPKNDFLNAQASLKNSLLTMQKLEAEKALPQAVLQRIHNLDGAINLVEETIDTWPSIFGFNGQKTYLVLFQNNMELRPGGGFIGSYGILTIANGKPGKLQIQDVYDADGHLTEQVNPPYGIQRYLGVSHWFLRDSNFDPDFPNDAQQAAFFLQKETGQKVDGVIGIDTTFIKNLISAVGTVNVPDYNVTVTPDNFYTLTETNAEKDFFPGSTQKKDFLRSLMNALLDKLSSEKQLPYEKFAQMIVSSTTSKDLLFAFSDPGIQNTFTVNGLSSALWDGRTIQKNTIDDYLGVVDANVGANKANYYVKRSISQTAAIVDQGTLQTTATVTYDNTSTKTSPFGGDYKDYVRFIIPKNTDFTSVIIDGKQVQTAPAVTDPSIFTAPSFTPPPALEVDQTEESDKRVIGFFFIAPMGTTRTVAITYGIPSMVNSGAVSFNYSLRLFKEPGTGDDPYQLSLSYPTDTTVITSTNGFTNVGGKLIYTGKLSTDSTITAGFSKK